MSISKVYCTTMLQLSKIPKNSTFFAYFYGQSRIRKLIFSFTSLQWRKRVSNNGWSWPLQSLNSGRAAILFYYYDSEILVGLKPLFLRPWPLMFSICSKYHSKMEPTFFPTNVSIFGWLCYKYRFAFRFQFFS